MCAPRPSRSLGASVLHAAPSTLVLLCVACESAPVDPPSEPPRAFASALSGSVGAPGAGELTVAEAQGAAVGAMGLTLPYFASASTSLGGLFDITQEGPGGGGAFRVSNARSGAPALFVGSSGAHFTLNVFSLGTGRAGLFKITNASNSNAAVEVETVGSGHAVQGLTTGTGSAGFFQINNASNSGAALGGTTNGTGSAVVGITSGTGPAGIFRIFSGSNSSPALQTQTGGPGAALLANHTGASGPIALFQSGGQTVIRFSKAGKGFFNGGIKSSGADMAEAFQVEGMVTEYEPGDVLVISERSDRRVDKAGEAYSTRVIGVYATKPGVLLTEREVDESLDDMVPVGVVGVIPTKVSAENGAIRRGDLLVTAATPGHAMKGTARDRMLGAILGKALEAFDGPATGVIQVMVNVK